MRKQKHCLIIVICCLGAIAAIFSYFLCKKRISLWKYNAENSKTIVVNNWDEICSNSDYSKEEVEALFATKELIHWNDLVETFSFTCVRETYQGYYSIISLKEGCRLFLFFDWDLNVRCYFFTDGFVERTAVENQIKEVWLLPESGMVDTALPYYDLNTGSNYKVFFFQDGIEVVQYTQTVEHINLYMAVREIPFGYEELRWNPCIRFDDLLKDISYIRKIDRQAQAN